MSSTSDTFLLYWYHVPYHSCLQPSCFHTSCTSMRMHAVYPCEAYANHVCHVRYYRSFLDPGVAGTGLTSIRACYTRYRSVSDRAELLQAMHQYLIVTGTSTVTCSRAALVHISASSGPTCVSGILARPIVPVPSWYQLYVNTCSCHVKDHLLAAALS